MIITVIKEVGYDDYPGSYAEQLDMFKKIKEAGQGSCENEEHRTDGPIFSIFHLSEPLSGKNPADRNYGILLQAVWAWPFVTPFIVIISMFNLLKSYRADLVFGNSGVLIKRSVG